MGIFRILAPFLANNSNLRQLTVSCWENVPDAEILSLALTLERCSAGSLLQTIDICNCDLTAESVLDLIPALAKLPQLKTLRLDCNYIYGRWTVRGGNIGRRYVREKESNLRPPPVCEALATLIRNSSKLEELSLCECAMGVEDVEMLLGALAGNKTLKSCVLFGKEGYGHSASTFLGGERGWGAITDILCDTSSVDATYLSNHTLERVYDKESPPEDVGLLPDEIQRHLRWDAQDHTRRVDHLPPDKVQHLLALNQNSDKKCVAMKKILLFHDEIDMKPLSEWGLTLLPSVAEWFRKAKSRIVTEEVTLSVENFHRTRLTPINQREFPMLYFVFTDMDAHPPSLLQINDCALRKATDETFIREVFGAYGEVTGISLPMRHGFGSVTFSNRVSANNAISDLDGHELRDPRGYDQWHCTLRISESKFQADSDGMAANIERKSLSAIFNYCRLTPDDLSGGYSRQQVKKQRTCE